jgi:hypothetical protein
MSLYRLAYYSMIFGGWSALIAWFACEFVIVRSHFGTGSEGVGLVGAIVGAAIGAGISVVPTLANAQWKRILPNSLPGLLGGLIGGACGGIVGNWLFVLVGLPRALGWMIMGLGIGVAEGLYERSPTKIRNGLIGGGLGGLIGGFLFDPILRIAQSGTGMSSRATAFVILGLSIGALIGLVQVVLKDAWLTVVDGYRSGRQLIVTQPVTVLGRADHLALPLLGLMNKDLEPEHSRICRQPDGAFAIEDNHSRLGTRLNGQVIQGARPLKDGDLIKLGSNLIRFNVRSRASGTAVPIASPGMTGAVPQPPPPPIVRKPTAASQLPSAAAGTQTRPATPPLPAQPLPTRSVPAPAAAPICRPSTPVQTNPVPSNSVVYKPPAPATQAPPAQSRPSNAIPPPPPPPPKRRAN